MEKAFARGYHSWREDCAGLQGFSDEDSEIVSSLFRGKALSSSKDEKHYGIENSSDLFCDKQENLQLVDF